MTNLQTLFNIQGQTAVITGGSGELGRPMAHTLAQAGARVAVLSLHAESSNKVASAIQAEGGQVIGIACDVLDQSALEQTLMLLSAFQWRAAFFLFLSSVTNLNASDE